MWAIVAFLSVGTGWAFAIQPNVRTIINRSVAANDADWKAQPNYAYIETDRIEGEPAKTYRVLMILGSRYQQLIATDGHPLPGDEQQTQRRKLQDVIRRRRRESPEERAERIRRYRKQRDQEHVMLQQMTRAFDFHLIGEGRLNGHDVWQFDALPRPGYRPPNQKARVLTGMRGKLWIDKASYHWVKVEAEVVHPVSIAGVLARVEPGTRFMLIKAPVAGDVWLPAEFSMNVAAKIIGIFSHNSREEDTYTDYRPNEQVKLAAR